ncbi:multiprotein-bridging factor 1 family protein [Nonomuraea sp. NPDC050790]|uniref:multiprotein-bridging factor 1 family protein n=1 Tax=Nonomuraea sp. NPDC050790 TaxID=3364371 RepID=UPI003788184F
MIFLQQTWGPTWVNISSQVLLHSKGPIRVLITAISSVLVGKTPGQLGVWLRGELTRRGYNVQRGGQSQLAREADIDVSIINRVLNEDRGVEIAILRKMGHALGYSLGEMLVHAGMAAPDELPVRTAAEQAAAEPPKPRKYPDEAEQLIWEIDVLSPVIREQLIGVLRATRMAVDEATGHGQSGVVRQFPSRNNGG